MNRSDWERRIQEIKNAVHDTRKLSRDDPDRSDRIAEISRQMSELINDEDVLGRPSSVRSERQIRQKKRDHKSRTQPILDAIKEKIEAETARTWDWGKDIWVGCDSELSYVRFDVWYDLDDDLDQDRSSGRLGELTSIMQTVVKDIADAGSEVNFHSRQTVEEKCDGDYFRYLR
jgi:hypothetical protein